MYCHPTTHQYIDKWIASTGGSQNDFHPFVLLVGAAGIGKTTVAQDMIARLLPTPLQHTTNLIQIIDRSEQLGKLHIIPIENDEDSDQSHTLLTDYQYINRGARDMISWMAMTSYGGYKIVFIEHIDRINPAAANALLKSMEEPYPNTLIIATASSTSSVLPTIVSRSFILPVLPVSDDVVHEHIVSLGVRDVGVQQQIIRIVQGKLGIASKLVAEISKTTSGTTTAALDTTTMGLLQQWSDRSEHTPSATDVMVVAQSIHKAGAHLSVVDSLRKYIMLHQMFAWSPLLVRTSQYLQSYVSKEHVLTQLLLNVFVTKSLD